MSENMYKRGYSSQQSQSVQSQADSSLVSDQPRPSSGFILFIGICLFTILLFLLGALLFSASQGVSGVRLNIEIFTFALLFLAVCVLMGIIAYIGYHITYLLTPHKLELKAGRISQFSIAIHQIQRIESVSSTSRLVGFGAGNAALCNRFHNVVCLYLPYKRVYLSPSDPEQFIAQLTTAMQEK